MTKTPRKSPENQLSEDPVQDSGPAPMNTELLLILQNQKVIMRALFEVMKTMAGNMEIAEEIKAQAKINYDYLASK